MKLRFDVKETVRDIPGSGGWFRSPQKRPVWTATLRIELTEEERAIATQRNLWDRDLFSYPRPAESFDGSSAASAMVSNMPFIVDLHSLANGIVGRGNQTFFPGMDFYTPQDAKHFEQYIVDTAMPKIKALINDSAKPSTGSRSYDF